MIQDGPFGLGMGMSVSELNVERIDNAPGKYYLKSVPKPHSAFETYVAMIGQSTGLAWIKAIGKNIATNVYGHDLKSSFEDLKNRLEKSYGPGEIIDILFEDSIWNEPKDWMSSIINKERILMCSWSTDKGSFLRNNLSSVALIAQASDTNLGYLTVEYTFKNENECEEEIAAEEDAFL